MNKIWKTIVIILLLLFNQNGFTQETTYLKNFPLLGNWKIMSYQIIGHPKMDKVQINSWVGNLIQFREPKIAAIQIGSTVKLCADFSYQITNENTERYFSKDKINPAQLGILESKVQVAKITCASDNWFGNYRDFVKVSDDQLISYWDNVVFFMVKQLASSDSGNNAASVLLITPQSVGMINPETDFNEPSLSKALAGGGYTFELVTHLGEEGETILDHFNLFRRKKLQLEIYPNLSTMKVDKIRIFDTSALATLQTHLGDTYTKVFASVNEIQLDCQMGVESEYEGKTLCLFEPMPTVKYVFQPQYLVDNKIISPIEALKQAKLVEWVWIADVQLVNAITEKEPVNADSTTVHEPTKNSTEVQGKALTTPSMTTSIPPNAENAYKFQEKRLNQLYERLNTILLKKAEMNIQQVKVNNELENSAKNNPRSADQPMLTLLKSQQDWTKYRDNNCIWHATLVNQELERTHQTFVCLEDMTRHRADEIEAILKQFKE